MKYIIIVSIILTVIFTVAGCVDTPKDATHGNVLNGALYYIQDPEAQLCFVVLRYNGNIALALCACNEVPRELLIDVQRVER